MSLSERVKYLSRPRVVRLRLDFPFVRPTEHLACRCSIRSHQWRWEDWTVDPARHALLNDHCISERDLSDHSQQPPEVPTKGDDTPAEEATKPSMVPDSGRPIQSTAPETHISSPDPFSVEAGTPMAHGQAETSLTEKTLINLRLADEAMKPIDPKDKWKGAVSRIKWVDGHRKTNCGSACNIRFASLRLSRLSLSATPVCKDGI